MTIQQRAIRIALGHLIISIFTLYILVAFEIPGRTMPLAGSIFAFLWGILNPHLYLIRKVMEIYTGLPLAFYAVFFLQVCTSTGLYFAILWWHDKQHKKKSNS